MSADRLAQIKARAEAATPGPWSAADERELWREEDPSIEPSWCVSHMRPGFEAMGPTEGYLGDVFATAGFFESTEADARFVAAAREDVPWLVSLVESLTAERDALAEGRCMANITLRDDEHRLALCVLPDGHRAAHDDLLGTSWTDETHYDQSEVEVLGPVSAAPDLLAALMQSIEREKQRRRDAVPCDKCGGDRLRADFVNPDRCHAPTTEAQR